MWSKEMERLAHIYTSIKKQYTDKGLWFPSFHNWIKNKEYKEYCQI